MPGLTRQELDARRAARRRRERRRRAALAVLVALPIAAVVALAVGLSGSSGGRSPIATPPPSALADPVASSALVAARRPPDASIATAEGVELKLPVPREAITAIAFHPVDTPAALALHPEGGEDYEIAPRRDRPGPETAAVDVGAPAGTPVYAPVSGVVVSVAPYTVFGTTRGYEMAIAPTSVSGLVVRMTHLAAPGGVERPRVGQAVRAGRTVVGEVADFSDVAEQEIAQFTNDSGNHVHIEVLRAGLELTP
jgi:murein DD-endopeptidase MepM/ murein hydrolase activator NlpD